MSGAPESLATALSDRYRLARELGAGGMATVYLAEDVRHNRQVAIKVLRDDLTASLGAERFLREISIAAGLTHPHVLPLHDSGEAGKRLFYVMPYVEGQSLRQKLSREGELPIGEAVRILRDVADAMAYAHGKGVVHRDLKPENIMLSGRHALVTDFGVAKALSEATGRQTLTTAGVALGTPSYMSPEQATADPHTDHRSDIYSFGVMAYELLAGQTPFAGRSPQEVLAAHVTAPVPPIAQHRSTIPPQLAVLVMQCLEKKPADRPQTAAELATALEAILTPSGGITPTATAPYAGVKPVDAGLRRWAVIAVGVGVIVISAGGVYAWLDGRGTLGPHLRSPLVVLPFEVQGTDKTLDPLGVQIAEQAAAAIEAASLTKVVSTPERVTGASTPSVMKRAVQATHAGTLMTGVILQRGTDVEITARMVRAFDLQTIWTLGPERAPVALINQAADAIKDRILGAVGAYIESNSELLGGNAALYPPPPSLEIYRLMAKADEYFRTGAAAKALPLAEQAYQRDTSYLTPLELTATIHFNAGRWRQRDSLTAFLEARRARLARGMALTLDHLEALERSPEDEIKAALARYAADSTAAYLPMYSAVRAQRFELALKFYAKRDTVAAFGRDWQAWNTVAAQAYHGLGRFADELALARREKVRAPKIYGLWLREVTALAALGRRVEIDSLVKASASLEYTLAPGLLLDAAAREFEVHGADAVAREYAERVLAAINTWPDSAKKRTTYNNPYRTSQRILGRPREVVDQYAVEARGPGGLGARILAARFRVLAGDTAGVMALVDSARTQPLEAFASSGWNHKGTPLYYAAHLLALLGRKDEAVAMLRESLNNGWRLNQQVTDEALQWYWKPIRDYAPFQALVKPIAEK